MLSKSRNFISFLCLLQFIHISTSRIIVPKEDDNVTNSLTQCIINIFQNYTNPSDTVSIMLNQNLNEEADKILLRNLLENQWTIYNSVFSSDVGSSTVGEVKNYLLQISIENETKIILNSLQNKQWHTQAKLIIFADSDFHNKDYLLYLIFESLWKIKVLNSIVILPEEGSSTIFNIYTWFPYGNGSCGGYKTYVLLDICINGMVKSGNDLFPDKVPKNLKGCPVKIRSVIHPPYAIPPKGLNLQNPHQTGINFSEGLDIQLFNTIAKAANFNIIYSISQSVEKWGDVFDNRTCTGIYKDLLKEEIDVVISCWPTSVKVLELFDLSVAFKFEIYIWCVPRASLKPKWLNVFNTYQPSTYILITITFLIIFFSTRMLSKMINDRETYSDTSNCFLNMYGVFLGVSSALQPSYSSTRIAFFMCVILNLILAAGYQSSLVSFLTKPSYERQISTLEELLESDLKILYYTMRKSSYMSDWSINKIMPRWSLCASLGACLHEVAYGGNGAMAFPSIYLFYHVGNFIGNDGRLMVHWFKEPFRSTSIHVYMTKGFPLRNNFDFYIFQILESGLQDKWMQDLQYVIKKNNSEVNNAISGVSDDEDDEPELLTLDELQGAFLVLLIGLTISCIVFIIELIVYKKTK